MASIRTIFCMTAGLLLCAAPAGASTLIIGGGAAKDCADAAIDGRSDNASLTTCTLALETEILSFRDQARTYVNRGAAYVGSSRYDEGLAQIDRGLALGVKDPQKAYYNRAIAHENLGDVKAAYLDFSKAAELDPDWQAPKQELTRFTVKRP